MLLTQAILFCKDPLSTYHLAECHEHGLGGLIIDNGKAFELYASAANLGHKEARFKMAMILFNGCPGSVCLCISCILLTK